MTTFFHTYVQAQLSDLPTGSLSYSIPFRKILMDTGGKPMKPDP